MGMTSRERVIRAIRREPTDCVAAMPYMYDIAAVTAGVPLLDFYTDPEAMVRAQLALYEQVGQDVIAIGSDNYYIAEGFGCVTSRDDGELPSLQKPPLSNINEVFDLEVPDPTYGRAHAGDAGGDPAGKAGGGRRGDRPLAGDGAVCAGVVSDRHAGVADGDRDDRGGHGGGERGGRPPCAGADDGGADALWDRVLGGGRGACCTTAIRWRRAM